MTQDPLNSLFVDGDEVDRKALASALNGLIQIDKRSGAIRLLNGFNELNSRQKLITWLLAQKAAELLGARESTTSYPKAIAKDTGMPGGTIRPVLRKLAEQRIVSATSDGGYTIEPFQINVGIEMLEASKK